LRVGDAMTNTRFRAIFAPKLQPDVQLGALQAHAMRTICRDLRGKTHATQHRAHRLIEPAHAFLGIYAPTPIPTPFAPAADLCRAGTYSPHGFPAAGGGGFTSHIRSN
jgi:hypothetical protein